MAESGHTSAASPAQQQSPAPEPVGDAQRVDLAHTETTEEPTEPTVTRTSLWWSRGDQIFVATMAAVVITLMVVHWARLSGFGMRPIEIDRQQSKWHEYRLDINSATWVEWIQLDGIGETLARRIVADREANGPFSDIDDLQRVKGIGPKTVDKLRPFLKLDDGAQGDSLTPSALE